MKHSALLILIAVAASMLGACAHDYTRVPSNKLCVAYMTTPSLNIYSGAMRKELISRGESCSAYEGQARAQAQANAQADVQAQAQYQAQELHNAQVRLLNAQTNAINNPPIQMPYLQGGTIGGGVSGGGMTAVWTGRVTYGTSVTGQSAANCDYQAGGTTFTRTFIGSCPSSIQVK